MNTLKQKTVTVELEDGRRIEVRRMTWKAMRDFLRRLASLVTGMYVGAKADGAATPMMARLNEVVTNSDELIAFICTSTTKLTTDDLDQMDALAVMKILEAALNLNCDEDTKNSWAGIAGSVTSMLSAKGETTTPKSPAPTATS